MKAEESKAANADEMPADSGQNNVVVLIRNSFSA